MIFTGARIDSLSSFRGGRVTRSDSAFSRALESLGSASFMHELGVFLGRCLTARCVTRSGFLSRLQPVCVFTHHAEMCCFRHGYGKKNFPEAFYCAPQRGLPEWKHFQR